MMKPSQQDQFKLSEAAALWVIRLGADTDEERRAEFFQWVRQSPKHMEEFMFAKAVSRQMEGLDPDRKVEIDISVLKTLEKDGIATLRHSGLEQDAGSTQRRRKRRLPAIGLAASVAALTAGVILFSILDNTPVFTTGTGDQQSIKLGDGSVMQLNALSRAEVNFSKTVRQVRLLEGEALFVVARDSARPFNVRAGSATIQAIGTQFNVYRRPNGTRVSVVEGAVQILQQPLAGEAGNAVVPLRLDAGAEAEISGGRVLKKRQPDIQRAVAWRSRRLVFHSDRLEDVVREFNRYNRNPIRLDTPEIGNRRISGVFDADDTKPLVEFLTGHPDFSITQTNGEITIGAR